jgi:hypothetical protein
VLISGGGKILCVGCDCAASLGDVPTTISCPNAVISPALINAHDLPFRKIMGLKYPAIPLLTTGPPQICPPLKNGPPGRSGCGRPLK